MWTGPLSGVCVPSILRQREVHTTLDHQIYAAQTGDRRVQRPITVRRVKGHTARRE